MVNLSRKEQLLAVEQVKKEMEEIEGVLNKWGIGWLVQYLDAHCVPLYYTGQRYVEEMERRYNKMYLLPNAYYSAESIGVPLATIELHGDVPTQDGNRTVIRDRAVDVDFGSITWGDIRTKSSRREITFHNDGTIEYEKTNDNKCEKKDAKKRKDRDFTICSGKYSVLTRDFDFRYSKSKKDEPLDHYSISLEGNELRSAINGLEITRYLGAKRKKISIIKKENNKTNLIEFHVILDLDNIAQSGLLKINVDDTTIALNFNNATGASVYCDSETGRVNLSDKPQMLYWVSLLADSVLEQGTAESAIIENFIQAIYMAIAKKSDVLYFDTASVVEEEAKVVDMVKNTKGELPIPELVRRINDSLSAIGDQTLEVVAPKVFRRSGM